jgi:hypothetical protein
MLICRAPDAAGPQRPIAGIRPRPAREALMLQSVPVLLICLLIVLAMGGGVKGTRP